MSDLTPIGGETLTLLTDVVERMHDITERKALLDSEYADLRTQLIAAVGAGKVDVGGTRVVVSRSRRFSNVVAARVLTPDLITSISRPVIDYRLAFRVLSADQYQMCKGPEFVTVRLT